LGNIFNPKLHKGFGNQKIIFKQWHGDILPVLKNFSEKIEK
jgi:hypothetical protein